MASDLGTDVIILHAPAGASLESQLRSLQSLEAGARRLGVRIALENLGGGSLARAEALLGRFGPDYLGVCCDTGHANLLPGTMDWLEGVKDRVISIHVHDNDGAGDDHRIPFTGTVSWERVARLVAASSYRKCVSLELSRKHHASMEESRFLTEALRAGLRLQEMIESARL
jgi:sugar phosphate isomerase/epimerase